jgi:ribose-phosphate pyrophosphokinase
MIDDIISTGSSMIEGAAAIVKMGAAKVTAGATHALFAEGAVEALDSSLIQEIVVTNTLNTERAGSDKIRTLSVAELLGEAIDRIHGEKSVSSLFV